MGSAPSSYYDKHQLSFLCKKNITTLKPVYLVYWKDEKINGWDYKNKEKATLTFHKPDNSICYCSEKYADFIMEINCNLTFYIIDIIGYCYNEGGVFSYEFEPRFFHKVKMSDCKIIKASGEYKKKFYNLKKINLDNEVFMFDSFFHEEHYEEKKISWFGNKLYDDTYSKNKMTNEEKLKYLTDNFSEFYKIENL